MAKVTNEENWFITKYYKTDKKHNIVNIYLDNSLKNTNHKLE